jgi:hypothetical protein
MSKQVRPRPVKSNIYVCSQNLLWCSAWILAWKRFGRWLPRRNLEGPTIQSLRTLYGVSILDSWFQRNSESIQIFFPHNAEWNSSSKFPAEEAECQSAFSTLLSPSWDVKSHYLLCCCTYIFKSNSLIGPWKSTALWFPFLSRCMHILIGVYALSLGFLMLTVQQNHLERSADGRFLGPNLSLLR